MARNQRISGINKGLGISNSLNAFFTVPSTNLKKFNSIGDCSGSFKVFQLAE